jgi:hypothetical protein
MQKTVTIFNPHLPLYAALVKALKTKGLTVHEAGEHEILCDSYVIGYLKMEIPILHTIIQFIDERYPCPPFFPNGAVQRCATRMLIDKLQTLPLDEVLNDYFSSEPNKDYFGGENPTLIDIFVSALAPETPYWVNYKKKVTDFYNYAQ